MESVENIQQKEELAKAAYQKIWEASTAGKLAKAREAYEAWEKAKDDLERSGGLWTKARDDMEREALKRIQKVDKNNE